MENNKLVKVLLNQYLRQLEDIASEIKSDLPDDWRKEEPSLGIIPGFSHYPVLSGLESFIHHIKKDIKDLK